MADWYVKNNESKKHIKNRVIEFLKSEKEIIFFDDIWEEIESNPKKYKIGESTAKKIINEMSEITEKFKFDGIKLSKVY